MTLLRNRNYLPLFLSHVLGIFNDNLFKNAATILITFRLAADTGHNPGVLVSIGGALFMLPFVLFSGLAGQLADKYEKSNLTRWLKALELPLLLLSFYALAASSIPGLLAALFGLGTYAAFLSPIKYGILPQALPNSQLVEANGLFEGSAFLAILGGTIAGGLIVMQTSGILHIGMLCTLLGILGFIAACFIPKSPAVDSSLKINPFFLLENLNLLKYVRQTPQLFRATLGIAWFWGMGAIILSLIPVYARQNLNGDAQTTTILLAMFSVGIAIGSVACHRILKGVVSLRFVPLASFAISLCGAVWVLGSMALPMVLDPAQTQGPLQMVTNPVTLIILLSLLGLAVSGGMFIVPLYAFIQAKGDANTKSRLIAGSNLLNAIFMVTGALLSGAALGFGASILQVLTGVMLANLAITILACTFLPQELTQTVLRPILKKLYRVKLQGMENLQNLPERTIVIANHTSYLDALLLAAFLPMPLVFAINEQVARAWWLRPILALMRTHPLSPTNPYALKHLVKEVKDGQTIMIFPEGRITRTGALMKVYDGTAMVAVSADAALLPVRVDGAQYTPFSYLRGVVKLRWFPQVTLTVLPVTRLEVDPELKGRNRRRRAGALLQDIMTDLVFRSTNLQTTLFASLLEARNIHGANVKILNDITFKPITYGQLVARSLVLGRKLKPYAGPQNTIGIMLPNASAAAATFFAAQSVHLVPAMLNFTVGRENMLSACQTACLTTVITSRTFTEAAKLTETADYLAASGLNIVYLEDIRSSLGLTDKLLALAAQKAPQLFYKAPKSQHEKPAAILFTSGSEGKPKAVVLTHSNLLANRAQVSARVDFNGQDTVLNALPMFHSFGLTGGTLVPLLSGVPLFLYPSPLHYRIIPEMAYAIGATILFGTDTFLAGYGKYAHPYDFYKLRYAFAGAEKLRPETRALWSEKFGVRIFEGYGATESSPVIALNTPISYRTGTVGRLLPGITHKLEKVTGTEGHKLSISGPNIMAGYWLSDAPGVLKAPDDWYDTGDIVSLDADGFISIVGRLKRFAKIGGEMISLGQVEEAANKLWPEARNAVISMPDARKGEQLVLFTTQKGATLGALRKHIMATGGMELAIPRTLEVIDKIPLFATGKVNYIELTETYTAK